MAYLLGRSWTREELGNHVGDLSQIAGIRLARWADGPEQGLRVAEVRSGGGLDFTVLLDRGMDIGPASCAGLPIAWVSPTGFAHPMFYDPKGFGWLRTFGGGLLTGCGLTNVGSPEEDEGESNGLHGRLSHLPARHVSIDESWQGDECSFSIRGEVRQAQVFGENLSLRRSITTGLGSRCISVHDVVTNRGPKPSPLMVLYHCNFGFPLLDSGCELRAADHAVQPRDETLRQGLENWMRFQPPTQGYSEQVFYHDLPADREGWAAIQLVNAARSVTLTLRFQKASLPNLIQWKMMGQGTYVLGLEPANCRVEGRSAERSRGTLQILEPGEEREFRVEIEITE
jgi:galactose mutarotase-like enzyme